MNQINVVIMAGGSGERFWPYSRKERPKQFLEVAGKGTLL
jgi:mannose-1-phosphate guanylyltransferase